MMAVFGGLTVIDQEQLAVSWWATDKVCIGGTCSQMCPSPRGRRQARSANVQGSHYIQDENASRHDIAEQLRANTMATTLVPSNYPCTKCEQWDMNLLKQQQSVEPIQEGL